MLVVKKRRSLDAVRRCLYCSVEIGPRRVKDPICPTCHESRRRSDPGLHAYTVATPVWLDRPTTARPGTPEKLDVLVRRAELGLHLWHPDDAEIELC